MATEEYISKRDALNPDLRVNGYPRSKQCTEAMTDAVTAYALYLNNLPMADVVPGEEYRRLLKIARAMHTWIFLNSCDEQAVYDQLGLTDEENIMLGYGGQAFIVPNEEVVDGQ